MCKMVGLVKIAIDQRRCAHKNQAKSAQSYYSVSLSVSVCIQRVFFQGAESHEHFPLKELSRKTSKTIITLQI